MGAWNRVDYSTGGRSIKKAAGFSHSGPSANHPIIGILGPGRRSSEENENGPESHSGPWVILNPRRPSIFGGAVETRD
jgi:hypothetical protein